MTAPHPLTQARHRDVARRRERVHQAIAAMTADAAEISASAVAARARVHRLFIHRHPGPARRRAGRRRPADGGHRSRPGHHDRQPPIPAGRQRQPARAPRRLQRRINDLEARLSESADNRDQPPMITSSAYG